MLDNEREHEPVVVPRSTRVSDDAWRVSTPARIGDDCRLHGNIRAQSLVVGRDTEIFGSLRGNDGVTVGAGTQVTGNVTTRDGTVRIGPDTDIRGDVSGEYVEIHQDADVEGAIRAREEMTMVNETVLDDSVIESVDVEEPSGEDLAGESTADEGADSPAGDDTIDSDAEEDPADADGDADSEAETPAVDDESDAEPVTADDET
jgi:cytoskeletal protein CcmA (bactofilin family)